MMNRIESVNRKDITVFYKAPFKFESELSCCFVQLVCMRNQYNDDYLFKYWDVEDASAPPFLCALACCVLEMFAQIAQEPIYEHCIGDMVLYNANN